MAGSDVGVIVLGPSHTPVASNREALRVLAFPNDPDQIQNPESFLRHRIMTGLMIANGNPNGQSYVPEFRSGKRRYMCTAFPIEARTNDLAPVSVALLFERCTRTSVDITRVAVQYGLTPRERELVQNLLLGLTTKEVAERMKVSPSTVSAFLHLVMVKMGVKTRSAVVRQIVCPPR